MFQYTGGQPHPIPADYEEVTVSTSVATPNSTKAGASKCALVMFTGGAIRWRIDGGNPTTVVGIPGLNRDMYMMSLPELQKLKMIRSGSTDGKTLITYYQGYSGVI